MSKNLKSYALFFSIIFALMLSFSQIPAQALEPTPEPEEIIIEEAAAETPPETVPESKEAGETAENSETETTVPETQEAAAEENIEAEKTEQAEAVIEEKNGDVEAGKKMIVRVSIANVRAEASIDSLINTQLKKGDIVSVLETSGKWYNVQLQDGKTGWSHKNLFTKAVEAGDKIKLTVSLGNIRKNPGLEDEIITKLKKGDELTVTDIKDEWYAVQLEDGNTGWAHKMLFDPDAGRQAKPFLLKGIRIETGEEGEEKIYFMFKGLYPPKTFFTKTYPVRIVCDFPNTRISKEISPNNLVNGKLVKTVRIGIHEEDDNKTRVVFDLTPGLEYELEHIFIKKEVYMLIVKKV